MERQLRASAQDREGGRKERGRGEGRTTSTRNAKHRVTSNVPIECGGRESGGTFRCVWLGPGPGPSVWASASCLSSGPARAGPGQRYGRRPRKSTISPTQPPRSDHLEPKWPKWANWVWFGYRFGYRSGRPSKWKTLGRCRPQAPTPKTRLPVPRLCVAEAAGLPAVLEQKLCDLLC